MDHNPLDHFGDPKQTLVLMSIKDALTDADLFKIAERATPIDMIEVFVSRIAQLSHDLGVARQQTHQASNGGQKFYNRIQELEHENSMLRHRIEDLKAELKERNAIIDAQIELEDDPYNDELF